MESVSSWEILLNRDGLKLVFEADKVVITKNGNFVRKGYLADGFLY